jgi:hypothetical protein
LYGTRTGGRPHAEEAVQPVVHDALIATLEKGGGMLGDSPLASKARWFCVEKVVEIRETDDGALKVGLDADCSELAAQGRTLVQGTGVRGPWLMELSRDGKGPLSRPPPGQPTGQPPDGAGYDDWIGRACSADHHRREVGETAHHSARLRP